MAYNLNLVLFLINNNFNIIFKILIIASFLIYSEKEFNFSFSWIILLFPYFFRLIDLTF